ncbi:hypothetical protein LMG3458_01265 [Achromobacter deleyi]|uniref:Secreted protein n=1 Tax=Achromobacter deleyi TaxID=1353891 RepID=A0A6S7A414_9BURK|nr:hypothetical protein [Achromobacter deleyi]CAB3674286.1 hypothetical protein LMG3458_01265 [Achromobacter deleyi]CAB3836805.1 hypothetical protein LMG3481_01046 [Achromobacter deleyi]CAB3843155.1 hypothetical protein LMG3482_01371 [Achromobacter deleyi]
MKSSCPPSPTTRRAPLTLRCALLMASTLFASQASAAGQPPFDPPTPAPSESLTPIRILAASPACPVTTRRSGGKVDDIYWTQGPYNARVDTDEVDHYVDLNLVVKTSGYHPGDCIEATIQADDGQDVAMETKTIVLRARVNEIGYAFFEAPMRRYTVILR